MILYRFMRVTLITPRARRWVRYARPARILHLFAGVCNLVNDRSEVISLVSPEIGPGPFTIMLDDFAAGLDVDQPVTINPKGMILTVGSQVMDLGQAAVWQPKPDWTRLLDADRSAWPAPPRLSRDIAACLEQTVRGIAAADRIACRAGVEGLSGRGSGLTPAGDDVLVGLLHGLWVWRPGPAWMTLILETAAPRTTSLSSSFLRAAAAGEAVWQWHGLVNGDDDAVAHILSIGHTSGTDAWAGFMAAASAFG